MSDTIEQVKTDFLKVMEGDYLMAPVEVEDWIADYLEAGVPEGESGASIAEHYANKYDLDKRSEINFNM